MPLHFGIMCRDRRFESWQVECLNQLIAVPGVEPAVLILEQGPSSAGLYRGPLSIPFRELAFRLWARVFGRPRARRRADPPQGLTGLPTLPCRVNADPNGASETDVADVSALRAFELDFVVRFAVGPLPADLLRCARYGVWGFRHGDWTKYRDGPPCFWDIYGEEPVTAAALVRLTDRDESVSVLKSGFLWTKRYSYARNAHQALSRSTRWPAQVCIDIRNGAADYLDATPARTEPRHGQVPNNREMLRFLARTCRNACGEVYRLLFRHGEWNVGVVRAPLATFLKGGPAQGVDWLGSPRRGEFLADPFGVVREGELTILCELLDARQRRGRIVSLETTEGTRRRVSQVAIGPSVHMSYPYLVEQGGTLFCIPETSQAREVGLYRVEEFPTRWAKVATLVEDFAALDSTVFHYGGRWWLTCGDYERGNADLFLFFAPALLGPWVPHPGNPVKTDARSARPAGTPFVHEGVLYRPAQDCSRVYGGRVVINRVTCLTPTAFAEEPVAMVEPDPCGPFPAGLHTLSGVGDVTLIDGKRTAFIPTEFRLALGNIIQALPGLSRWRGVLRRG